VSAQEVVDMRFRHLLTFTAVLLGATVAALLGQQPAVEVASVKVDQSEGRDGKRDTSSPGTLEFTNSTLQACIRWAYDVRDSQVSGAPGWLNTDRYDILAKAATPNTSGQQERLMLQALLAERFKLQVHRGELPAYSLVVGKGGAKLQRTTSDHSSASDGRGLITDRGVTSAMLATQLSTQLERIVVDKTGLTEKYDLKLEWVPELDADSASGPSVFTAIQEQLGLKLESTKGDVEVLVIDHIERVPTEN
jgi:uncharacterized protein (TIGR03435 family)